MKVYRHREVAYKHGWSDSMYQLPYGHSFSKAVDGSEAACAYEKGFYMGKIERCLNDLKMSGIDFGAIDWKRLETLMETADWQFNNSSSAPTNNEYNRIFLLLIACGFNPGDLNGKSVFHFRRLLIEFLAPKSRNRENAVNTLVDAGKRIA